MIRDVQAAADCGPDPTFIDDLRSMALLRWMMTSIGGHWSGDQIGLCLVRAGWLSLPT